MNAIAVVWIAFITVLFVLPPNELTGKVFAIAFVLLLAYYAVAVRGKFKGPVPQARSEQDLLRMEQEFENLSGATQEP